MIGLDSTSALVARSFRNYVENSANDELQMVASYRGFPGIGRHTLVMLEYSEANGTSSWYGDNGLPLLFQAGISGEVWG